MNSVTNCLEQSELALAAYAELNSSKNIDDYRGALEDAGMAIIQARQFAATWYVVDQYTDPVSGLSATVFQHKGANGQPTGPSYLAIRGTDPTELGDITADYYIVTGFPPEKVEQYQVLKAKVTEWIGNGTLSGNFTVAGHSLGGWLAAALSADFGSVGHVYLYNAPGSGTPVADILQAVGIDGSTYSTKITSLRAGAGISPFAGLGYDFAPPIRIAIENQLDAEVTDPPLALNHSQRVLTDALAVYAAYAQVAPTLNIESITTILKASGNEDAYSLETALDNLRYIIQGPYAAGTVPEDRESLYAHLRELQAALVGQPGRSIASLSSLSRDQVAGLAKTDIAYRYALEKLNPFAVTGDANLYAQHNTEGQLDVDRFSDLYLKDRAAMLAWKIKFDRGDLDDDDALIRAECTEKPYGSEWDSWTVNGDWRFTDYGALVDGQVLTFLVDGVDLTTTTDHQILFGGDHGDTLLGDTLSDHLYGGVGDDTLTGGLGDDHLEGGAGLDTYIHRSGGGNDMILDRDGVGRIQWDGLAVKGRRDLEPEEWRQISDHQWYDARNGYGYLLIAGPSGDTLKIIHGAGTLTVRDWEAGELGIDLGTGQVPERSDIIGTEEADNLNGTAGNDRILGLGQGDTLNATQGGNDRIEGGDGDDILTAGGGNDQLLGGDGRDRLTGNGGMDVLAGNAGEDALLGDSDMDSLYAGDEVSLDDAYLDGEAPTGPAVPGDWLNGGGSDDVLVGDRGFDVLLGGDGGDTVLGGQGDDYIDADDETGYADAVYGGSGKDWIVGNGADTIFGGLGDDYIVGIGGESQVWGGEGNDVLAAYASDRFDLLKNPVNDPDIPMSALWADLNAAYPLISQGIDTADSGELDLRIGRITDPPVTGGSILGNGWTYRFDFTFGADGEMGSWQFIYFHPTLAPDGKSPFQGLHSVAAVTDTAGVWLYGEAGNDRIGGSQGGDVLDGGDDADHIAGFNGNDFIQGGSGEDILAGGRGDDFIEGGTESDSIVGESGDDILSGGDGNDNLQGDYAAISGAQHGDDVLYGGTGDDTLFGQGGDDQLDGGGDNDHLEGDDSSLPGEYHGDDTLAGGAGNDLLFGQGGNDVLDGGADDDELQGDAYNLAPEFHGDDRLQGGAGIDHLIGQGGRDTLEGGADDDMLEGDFTELAGEHHGNDVLLGGDGNDLLVGQGGDDQLDGGIGNDELQGDYVYLAGAFHGHDTLDGGAGNDRLFGGGGKDLLLGGDGADDIYGEAGDDTITGGTGEDTLRGGSGSDVYVFDVYDGLDNIIETEADPGDVDTLRFGTGITPDRVKFDHWTSANGEDGLKVTVRNNSGYWAGGFIYVQGYFNNEETTHTVERLEFADGTVWTYADVRARMLAATEGADLLEGYAWADVVDGLGGDDNINGKAGNDTLLGGEGNDKLQGGMGNDLLEGGAGNDTLYGYGTWLSDTSATLNETGADTLHGGPGRDTLYGGRGNDTYLFGRGDGYDFIGERPEASGSSQDVLRLGTGIFPEHVTLYRVSDGIDLDGLIVVVDGSSTQIKLTDYFSTTDRQIERIEFDGGAGPVWTATDIATRVQSGTQNSLMGSSSDDIFVVDHERDAIVETTGGGIDTVQASRHFTLPENVENLILTGVLNINAVGNALENVLTGNASDNVLDGKAGTDTAYGGLGDDTYKDVEQIIELPGEGSDTVISYWGGTLSDNVENLFMHGTNNYFYSDVTAIGNDLDNILTSRGDNSGYFNVLDGRAGADTMMIMGEDKKVIVYVDNPGDKIIGDAYEIKSTINYVLPVATENLTLIGTQATTGYGNAGNNILTSWENAAANTLFGGKGNDHYRVDENDVVIELPNEGYDKITISSASSFTYEMTGTNIEEVYLEGDGAVAVVGTDADDVIISSNPNSTLIGGLGNDRLQGWSWINGGEGDDVVQGSEYSTVYGGIGNDDLSGGYGSAIHGESGDDILRGGQMATLVGGAGNDTYFSGRHALIFEEPNGGHDTVAFSVDDFLDGIWLPNVVPGNVEDAFSTGTGVSITGNELDNRIVGDGGNNYLDGGLGNDTLVGGDGSDTYSVYDSSDVLVELAGGGFDTVESSISYVLGDNFERLGLLGESDIDGTGNASANFIYGNAGANLLQGLTGDDKIEGLAGQDTIHGDDGDDELSGEEGDDILDGGAGADVITGGLGNDTLRGGAGSDTYIYHVGDGMDIVEDTDRASADIDALVFSTSYWVTLGHVVVVMDDGDIRLMINPELIITDDNGTVSVAFTTPDQILIRWNPEAGIGIENVKFSNGMEWDALTLLQQAQHHAPISTGLGGYIGTAEGLEFVYVLPANMFVDYDPGDSLAWAVSLESGEALPNWLSFDPETRTLRGTPPQSSAGQILLHVAVTDTSGKSAYEIIPLIIGTPIVGTEGPDILVGDESGNYILGLGGNDSINGGGDELDILVGGLGDDTYIFDVDQDDVIEEAYSGIDTVISNLEYELPENVENLTLTGAEAIYGYGNSLNNIIIGNSIANELFGGAGDDLLNGGPGSDRLYGELGSDIYVVDSTSDTIIENADEGTDLVQSSVTYTLSANVENLTLTGGSAINGTGNALDNVLTGNSANNTLNGGNGNDRIDGGPGSDTMVGGAGDDTYYINVSTDRITENANQGTDTVNASITLTLANNVENLILTGTSAINGTGNTLANYLRGNGANNTLKGSGGNDLLEGGAGNDMLTDTSGLAYMNGGTGTDTFTGGTANQLFIGGAGNDTITTGNGADILVFNRGDGADTVYGGTGTDNVVSLGGGIRYADMTFSKSSNDLVLNVGNGEKLTFKNWYVTTANNKTAAKLQVILDATADYNPGGGDALYDNRVEQFDFAGLAAQFDLARTANPGLTSWALTNALTAFHLGGDDSAALGGDLAYRYGRNGSLAGMNASAAQEVIGGAGFGTTSQTLREFSGISGGMTTLA